MLKWTKRRDLKVLDFDLENRPLSYRGNDLTTAEITAIAASWVGSYEVECMALGPGGGGMKKMLRWFRKLYDEADLVTGHYIRRHDLPLLNAAYLEMGMGLLGPKLTSDTYLDLAKRKDLSASQEALSAMYGLEEPKHHMTQEDWRSANRLTTAGIETTKRRAISEVVQHIALRKRLIEAGVLKAPRMWFP